MSAHSIVIFASEMANLHIARASNHGSGHIVEVGGLGADVRTVVNADQARAIASAWSHLADALAITERKASDIVEADDFDGVAV